MSIISIGQTVQVQLGQKDEETNISLAAWSDRVVALYPEHGTVEIEWDSFTLMHMPDSYICHSLDEGYDYLRYIIESCYLKIIIPKDTTEQVLEIQEELESRCQDYQLYNEPSIPFSAVERDAFMSELLLPQTYATWLDYLEKHLLLPFDAKVVEGRRKLGQKLTILALDGYEDSYGIIAIIKWADDGGDNFLLCDLEAVDRNSPNYQILRKYVIWFANQ